MRCLQLTNHHGEPTRLVFGALFVVVCGFVWGMDRIQPTALLSGILTGIAPILVIGSGLVVTLLLFSLSYFFEWKFRREVNE